jgi:trigger factor
LVIDFLGRIGGEEFAGGKAEGYELTLGSGTFIPRFEEQLIGVKVGDKIEVKVKFPDSYGAAELSGKDAVFDVTVNELKETVPSAIDDELAKKVGMENLEALKKSIREEQESEFNEMSRMILKRALLDELSAAHDFEIPEKLLDREFDTIWKQFEEQRKKDKDAGQGSEEKTDDEHKKDFREIAERRVRLGLLLSEVGRANNVQISQEDVNSQLMAEARRHPGREKEVMEHYKNNPEAMEELSAPLYEEKVVNFILEQASITEKTATKDELIKTMEDEAAGKPKAKAKAAAEKKAAKKDK